MLKAFWQRASAGSPDDGLSGGARPCCRTASGPARARLLLPRRLPGLRGRLPHRARLPSDGRRPRSTWAAAFSAPTARPRAPTGPSASPEHRMAVVAGGPVAGAPSAGAPPPAARRWRRVRSALRPLAQAAAGQRRRLQRLRGRTCNVLGTVVLDLGRFGIQFVASPRHADGLLITGPVTENMKLAWRRPTRRCPRPAGHRRRRLRHRRRPLRDHPEVHDGAAGVVPVDLFIPAAPAPADHPRRPAPDRRQSAPPRRNAFPSSELRWSCCGMIHGVAFAD